MIKLIIDVPALRKPISKNLSKAVPKSDAPSGRVEAPDELFDLPHLNVGFRYILNLTHIGKTLVRSGSDIQDELEGYRKRWGAASAGRRSDLRTLLKLFVERPELAAAPSAGSKPSLVDYHGLIQETQADCR